MFSAVSSRFGVTIWKRLFNSKYLNTYHENLYLTLKPYVVGTQKNRHCDTILVSTHNIVFGWVVREILWEKDQFTPPYLTGGVLSGQSNFQFMSYFIEVKGYWIFSYLVPYLFTLDLHLTTKRHWRNVVFKYLNW